MPVVVASLGRCCSSTAGFADVRHETHSPATAVVKGNSAMEALGALPVWCGLKGEVVQTAGPQGAAQHSPVMSFQTYRPYWIVEFGAGWYVATMLFDLSWHLWPGALNKWNIGGDDSSEKLWDIGGFMLLPSVLYKGHVVSDFEMALLSCQHQDKQWTIFCEKQLLKKNMIIGWINQLVSLWLLLNSGSNRIQTDWHASAIVSCLSYYHMHCSWIGLICAPQKYLMTGLWERGSSLRYRTRKKKLIHKYQWWDGIIASAVTWKSEVFTEGGCMLQVVSVIQM